MRSIYCVNQTLIPFGAIGTQRHNLGINTVVLCARNTVAFLIRHHLDYLVVPSLGIHDGL